MSVSSDDRAATANEDDLSVDNIDDLRIRGIRPLVPSACLIESLAGDAATYDTVNAARSAISRAVRGEDSRLVIVAGPTSAHDPAAGFVLPGVFFIYDISPIMVKFTEKTMSFSYFLTSLCAIVGGVFTTAGIVDGLVYHTAAMTQRREGVL